MLVLAHRGYHAVERENTLVAFAAALALGVDGIETDVRLSADGKPVIMHDRVTPAGHAVSALTHRELERDVGHAVPLLPELLDAFPDTLWNIEIKLPEAWPATMPVLKQYLKTRRLLVSSFRHDLVVQCAAELDVDCALLLASRPLDMAAVTQACVSWPRLRGIVWDYNILDDAAAAAVTAAGWRNYAYGAQTVEEHARCARLGLAGLITDHPQRAGAGA